MCMGVLSNKMPSRHVKFIQRNAVGCSVGRVVGGGRVVLHGVYKPVHLHKAGSTEINPQGVPRGPTAQGRRTGQSKKPPEGQAGGELVWEGKWG